MCLLRQTWKKNLNPTWILFLRNMEEVDGQRSPGRERKVHRIKKQLFNRFYSWILSHWFASRFLILTLRCPSGCDPSFEPGMGGTLQFSQVALSKGWVYTYYTYCTLIYHESTSASTTIIYHTVILICPHPHQYTPTCPLFQITFCKFKTHCFHSKVREAFNPYSVLELTAGDVGEVSWVFLNLSDDDRSGQRRTGMRMKLIIIIMHGDGKGNGHQTHHIWP